MYCAREDLVSRRVDITSNQTSPTHNRSPEPVNNYDDQQEDFDLYLFSGGRSPAYLLEHLATFTVSPENDLVYPADGMRRLLAMEKTSGIWTQKMLMRLERKMVNIMDHENKEVVERFPAHFVREPTAFTSNDPKVRLGRERRGRKVRLREIVFLAAVL